MSDTDILYKLVPSAEVPEDAWKTRNGWTTAYAGDQSKKFISLLTDDQVAGAAEASFAGRADVMLLSFVAEKMEQEADLKIKFEAAEAESGGSGKFAHAYGGVIPFACLFAPPQLLELSDGKHIIPPLGPVAIAAAKAAKDAAAKEASGIEQDDEDWDNDTSEAFDQHRFDLDDEDNANYVA